MARDGTATSPLPPGGRSGPRAAYVRGLAWALSTALLVAWSSTGCSGEPSSRPAVGTPSQTSAPRGLDTDTRVLAISVDGLSPVAIRRLGAERTPTLHRLLREGASTLEARTVRERTETLPNHASMLTGRRVDAERGGHGVTWNHEIEGSTVQQGAGHPVASVFTTVRRAGGSTALFSTKTKFSLFDRSWPRGIVRFRADEEQERLVRAARRDLVRHRRALTFLHVSLPDLVGHEEGYQTDAYDDAIATTDRWLGRLVATIRKRPALRRHLVVVLTADHGGRGTTHGDATKRVNFRVPFLVWGRDVRAGDLYELDDDYRHPERRRTTYAGRQPVRNADLANLVTRALGLGAVPGSELGRSERLAEAVLR
ncbi:alkaline phosphatase family protein [Nocardioides ferulae]|uniref:alkaline phosphatase family protein n=1 Tax=Nocardioides ferulae TaxID=2340821 RepID=UPI000EB3F174|nr:alkaline phosphatase family protein [Nocardioides ferulae]